jgi:hypothetical protein
MKPVFLAAAAVLLAACSDPPPLIEAGADPADPHSRVPPLRYVPVTAGTVDYQPVAPQPWAQRNRGVAPQKEDGK